ncbi:MULTISPECIES: N-acetylmuramoyl-L-alanine amidase [unclassified Knoellia]|uniref:N-acetylmuramoyl-L-alanine amidase n=1 Tax=Knoellia altitudinis TaxID=3404795 RepID=UPI003621C6B0
MSLAPRTTRRPVAARAARVPVLVLLGSIGLTALPMAGAGAAPPATEGAASTAAAAAVAPTPVTPTLTKRAVADLRTVAPDTVEVPQSAPIVALTWKAGEAPPAEATILVRVRAQRGGWGPWLATSVDDTTDPSSPHAQRVGTDPVWVGPGGSAVQIRLPKVGKGVSAASSARSTANHGQVELIDPGRSDPDGSAAASMASVQAVTARPSIVSRAGWGADESLRTCGPSYGRTLKGVFVHHTAGSNSYTASQSAGIVRGIYAYHTKSLGWCDVGYNVLVDKYGQTFEGRAGGLERVVTGAHALGFNSGTWGVSVLGNYSTATPTSATMSALARVIAWRSSTFYRSPTGTTTLTSADSGSRFPKGTKVALPFISAHRDTNTTECPGSNLYARLPALRSAVDALADHTTSRIYRSWVVRGGERWLGPVEQGERATPFGTRTIFGSGTSLWSTASNVFHIGPEATRLYELQGGEAAWGPPVGGERSITGGMRTDFAKGVSAVLRFDRGQAYAVHGAIRTSWDARGGPSSPPGMPASHMWQPTPTGWAQSFQNGQIHHSGTTGARFVSGEILARFLQFGASSGRLGYPATEKSTPKSGAFQVFQLGGLAWHPTTGAHGIFGSMNERYVELGGPASSLGFPVAENRLWSGGYEQDFQGGVMRWHRATGAVTVTDE